MLKDVCYGAPIHGGIAERVIFEQLAATGSGVRMDTLRNGPRDLEINWWTCKFERREVRFLALAESEQWQTLGPH